MTNQDHVFNILDDALLLLSGQGFPTPERTYKLDGGWGLALSDLRRCFDRYRTRIAELEAERDAAMAGEARAVEALEAEQRAAHWRNLARITDKHEDALEAGRLSEIAQRLRHGIVLVLTNTQPALDWLAEREREAAARELEGLVEREWKWEEFELKASIYARIADLRDEQHTACSRSEV
jgi:hypothetical protein